MKSRLVLLACLAARSAAAQQEIICRECHPREVDQYAQTGMARSFGRAGSVPPGTYRHGPSAETFSVFARGGSFWLRREQQGFDARPSNVLEKAIEYRFGSGDHASSYFGRDSSGGLIELPLTWYSAGGGHWAMSPGYEAAQHAGFGRKIHERCFFCHTSEGSQTAGGIGCDRCHGTGAAHIQAVGAGRVSAARATIVNPVRLSPARNRDVCLQCHLETTNLTLPGAIPVLGRPVFSFQPGEALTDYSLYFDHAPGRGFDDKFEFSSAPYRLFKSACYRQSGDALTCTTCHNPHRPAEDRARSLRACRNCHAAMTRHHAGRIA